MIQPVSIHEIDRTVYESLRLSLVSGGFLPDITKYQTELAYNTAKDSIRTTKGLIEVYGVGSSESRDAKETSKIIIDRMGMDVGVLGGYPASQFEPDTGGKFKKRVLPDMTMDLNYDVRIITNSVKTERLMAEIIFAAFGVRKYVPVAKEYNANSDEAILFNFNGDVDVSASGMKERVYKYSAKDVWLRQHIGDTDIVRSQIAPLTSVLFQVSLSGLGGTPETGEKILSVEIEK